jgi:hypothetical protein
MNHRDLERIAVAKRSSLVVALLGLWAAVVLGVAVPASPLDENELRDQFNKAVNLVNAGQYAEGRKQIDALEKAARQVKADDPAYKLAQDLLERTPGLRVNSFHNSYINALNGGEQAVRAVKLDAAAAHFTQAAADLDELVRLKPGEQSYQNHRALAKRQRARAAVVEALLQGKESSEERLKEAALDEPRRLYQSAPAFTLPLWDKPGLFDPFLDQGSVILVQLWSAADLSA